MSLGKQLVPFGLALLALAFAGCSGGSTSGLNTIETAVQDLGQDDEGLVTVLTFAHASGLAGASTANFSASHGQSATTVDVAGDTVTITWDARVSPADTVAATGLSGVDVTPHAVTTSDDSAPTYTVTSADMNAGLGADVITLQFSGPHLVQSTAEDVANWTLSAGSFSMDLSDSSFSFDTATQVLTMNLGTTANVWSDFTLNASGVKSVGEVDVDGTDVDGTGSGDASAPALVSADQNLDEDEFGRVVDFTFDEALSPLVATTLGRYGCTAPDVAVTAEQVSATLVRVTFNNPIVPGLDTIDLNGLYDAHGNAFPDVTQAIDQPDPVTNTVDGAAEAVTVSNAGNDYITLTTTQAFDPDSAEDYSNWTLHVAGNPIDLSTQTFSYDLESKTTTITLDFDLHNGDTFTLVATSVVDVDGETAGLGDFQTVGGDTTAPSVVTIVQNRTVDPTGATVDVSFDEDMDETAAETGGNWASGGTQNLVSATLLNNGSTVRLVFDAPMIPTVDGLSGSTLSDLAGNTMSFSDTVGSSTDTTVPTITASAAHAVEGADNDTLVVTFDDDMWEASVGDTANWTVESPIGTSIDVSGCSVDWNSAHKRVTLTLDNGVDLQNGDDFSISFSGVYDLGHNAVSATATTGTIDSETTLPELVSAYLENSVADEVVVTFSEPCTALTDLYDSGTNPTGTRYVLRDNLGALRGTATGATALSGGLGVRLTFGVVVGATDTLDVLGVTDLAGNPLFPVLSQALLSEDSSAPTLGSFVATTVSGECNDTVVLTFDRPMCPWGMQDISNYVLTSAGAGLIELNRAELDFDGNDTLTITLAGTGLHNLSGVDNLTVDVSGVYSAQGTAMSGTSSVGPQAIAGDVTAPTIGVSGVKIDPANADSLLIEFDEAVDQVFSETAANYDLNSGNLAVTAVQVGPRVVRATFAVTPQAGDSLDVVCEDLALNSSGTITRTVQSADSSGPLVSSVAGGSEPGFGGDTVSVTFSEPVLTSSAFGAAHYTITSNGQPISLVGATASYVSATNTVIFQLASGQELDSATNVHVTISGVQDVSGNAMSAPVATTGAVSGDTTAPTIASSFVNWQLDSAGLTVDVRFSEDVLSSAASNSANWSTNGSATVSSVTRLDDNHYRVTLSAALGASELVRVVSISDPAGNAVGGTLSSDPEE